MRVVHIPQSVPPFAAAEPVQRRVVPRAGAAVVLGVTSAIACLLVGTGWLDGLRGWGVLGIGPHVTDALPLRELAGEADQPLLRVLAGWIPTGVIAGVLLHARRPGPRAALVGIPFFVLYVLAADAEHALARNLHTWQVIQSRGPDLAAFVATASVIAGASLVSVRRRRP